jgi:NadR type nicotinamide-nucleotide adenylyltransferase
LHKGHELVIQHAIACCDEVLVISYTKPEFAGCPPCERKAWINALFPSVIALVLDDECLQQLCTQYQLPPKVIPHNDAPDINHREFVGWLCWEILQQTVDAVFTSEDYGNGFADILTTYFKARTSDSRPVSHVCVDKARNLIPTSGTSIRSDPHLHKQFLSPTVYASFVKRICILGGESSGKTTLTNALADHFDTAWVPEYGRELWDKKEGNLHFDDMLKIGQEQIVREKVLAATANHWLFCDTSPLTTLFYSMSMFNRADAQLLELANRRYDAVFLCTPDFPFVQDGTRKDDDFRQRQHTWYLNVLADKAIPYYLISGAVEPRIKAAANYLTTIVASHQKRGS